MERLRNRFLNKSLEAIIHPALPQYAEEVQRKIEDADAEPRVTQQELTASELFERAFQHAEAGDLDQAIAHYTEVIRHHPQYGHALLFWGHAYKQKDDFHSAIDDYSAAIRIHPYFAPVYCYRARAKFDKGDYHGALEDYDAALQIDPDHQLAHKNREIALKKLNRQ